MVTSRQASPSGSMVDVPGPTKSRGALRVKLLVVGLIILASLGVLCASLLREAAIAARTAAADARPSLAPPRPALTPAEEAYAHALWAIHGDVKNAAFTLTFSGLRYKLSELEVRAFETGMQAASKTFSDAEARVRALTPPPSLSQVHRQYLDAVHLFQQSAAEMLKVTEDGRDDHLLVAHPLSHEASEKLLRVGNVIWPGEYLPN
jgi:hypothetical protein